MRFNELCVLTFLSWLPLPRPVQRSTFIHNCFGGFFGAEGGGALGAADKRVYKTFHSKSKV